MTGNSTAVNCRYKLPFFVLLLFFCPALLFAQNSIRGRVTDSAANTGLSRINVTVRGTNRGVITDANGNFSISASRGDVLVFSGVGYQTQNITVSDNGNLSVTLSSRNAVMNEVVVIGYGTRQKKDVTGAVSNVTSKEIEKSTAMSPELALQGRAAGVFVSSGGGDPNARPTIRIRGVNTFGYAEPLYVVDGVPMYEGGSGVTDGAIGDVRSPVNIFSMINPQDIESISVLKDASAAAIYGVRASNGVIIITTKRGKSGRPRVEVASSFGVQNIPKTIKVLNTSQYFSLVKEAYANNPEPNTTFEKKFGPLYDATNARYAGNGPTYDWQRQLLNRDAPLQDHSVRLSGGSEATTYYVSLGYAKTESPLKGSNLERYSIATNVESRISKYILTGLTLRLVQENSLVNTQADLGTMISTIPFQPIFDPSDPTGFAAVTGGTFKPNPDYDPTKLDAGPAFIYATGPDLLWGQQTRFNVFAFQQLNNNRYDLVRSLGNAFVEIEPITGLRLRGTLGGDYFINLRKQWQNLDNWRFSQTPGNPYAGNNGKAVGTYGERQGKTYNINKEVTLNYSHTFASNHNVDVILSASNQFARWSVNDLSGQVDYADPQYRGIANLPPYTTGFSSILQEDALIGYMGRISYKFKDKYYLDGTYRRDGSSRLAPGHKWDGFPSFAAAWRISSESFFPKSSTINDLKLRGGWGKLGNFQSAGFYRFLSGVFFGPDYPLGSGNGNPFGTQTQGAALPDFANTTLTWERLTTTNLGFDAQLFNNRVSLTAEYYNKLTSGIIQSVSLPPNTGIQNPADLNVGEVRNKGIELQLGYNNRLGPVNFSVLGNLTTVNNELLKINRGTPFGGEGGRFEEGYSLGYLWGYKTAGIFQSQAEIDAWRKTHADVTLGQTLTNLSNGYQYKPGDLYFQDVYGNPRNKDERYNKTPDSLVNSNDRTFLGKTIPGYYYGLNINANFKGIDISIFFQGVGDVKKYNYLRAGGEALSGLGNSWETSLNRWTPTNTSATMPRAVYNDPAGANRFSDRFVESAGYMRLKNLQIGYSIPRTVLGHLGFIQSFRIYGSAINLITVTKWKGIDPENDLIPPTRQFLVGLNASF